MRHSSGIRLAATAVGLVLLVAAVAAPLSGDQPKKGSGKVKVIEAKGEKYRTCAGTNFASALGLNLQNLTTLGARIDQARLIPDPVALGLIARELAIAEQISKKAADPTAEALLKEAVDLAKLRKQPEELQAVARLSAKGARKELLTLADKAAKAAEDRKNGERKRGVRGTLIVYSYVDFNVTVYVNGGNRGTVGPHGTMQLAVNDPVGTLTRVDATAPASGTRWPTRYLGDVPNSFGRWIYELR